MARTFARMLLITVLLAIGGRSAAAHHSFGAEYDAEKPITIKGVLTRVDWANPHCHFYMKVTEAGGKVTEWKFEGYPPNVLARTGFRKDVTLKVGDPLTVFGWLARDGSPLAHAREVTFSDGKKLYFGPPAGTGEGGAVAR